MYNNPQNLKTVLYTENFFEMPDNVVNTNSFNVIDYKYRFFRERDEFNVPYGSFLTENLTFTVKASTLNDCMIFYQFMDENRSHPFSIIFDPVFNAYNEQLTVKISLILNKMSYLGMESLHELNITND